MVGKQMVKKSYRERKYTPGGYDLRVKRSYAGLGLFAGEDIPKGACVIEYAGRPISKEEEETSRSKYLFEIRKGKTIDGKPKWNKAGYINHSCRPNCEPEMYRDHMYIMAIRNIKKGDEISYDYGKEYFDDHIKPHGCRCGATTHRYGARKKTTAKTA